jgi:hypothetical protein
MRLKAYENASIYKERIKRWYDKRLKRKSLKKEIRSSSTIQGLKPYVGTFSGTTSTQRSSLQHLHAVPVRPARVIGQTGVAGKIRRETNERRPSRIPSGRRTQGCPRLGRPARTSSNIAEMKEKHHDRVGKVRGKRNEKVNTTKIDSIVISPSIGRGPLYL